MCAKSFQLCPTLCDPVDCSLTGSSVMGVPRQEYWSAFPGPPPGVLPDPGIEPVSPALGGRFFTFEPPEKPKFNKDIKNSACKKKQS